MAEAFERQEREGDEAWQAFEIYRDLGPSRNMREVARRLNKSVGLMGQWSSRWRWQQRVAAWDAEVDRARRTASLSAVSDMVERHANHTQAQMQALMAPARELLRRLKERPNLLEQATDAQLIRFVAQSARAYPALVQAERLARGLSTENVDVHMNGSDAAAVGKSNDELDAYLLGVDRPAELIGARPPDIEGEGRPPVQIEAGG